MKTIENVKTLFILDIQVTIEQKVKKAIHIPDDILFIKSVGAVISDPYGDLMRSVLFGIYHEGIKQIVFIGSSPSKENDHPYPTFKISEDTLNTLDYLFPHKNLTESPLTLETWLNQSPTKEELLKSADLIKEHPLLPFDIPVHSYWLDPDTKQLQTIDRSLLSQR